MMHITASRRQATSLSGTALCSPLVPYWPQQCHPLSAQFAFTPSAVQINAPQSVATASTSAVWRHGRSICLQRAAQHAGRQYNLDELTKIWQGCGLMVSWDLEQIAMCVQHYIVRRVWSTRLDQIWGCMLCLDKTTRFFILATFAFLPRDDFINSCRGHLLKGTECTCCAAINCLYMRCNWVRCLYFRPLFHSKTI